MIIDAMDLMAWTEACQSAFNIDLEAVEYWDHPSAYFESVSVMEIENEIGGFNQFVFKPRIQDRHSDVQAIAPMECVVYPTVSGLGVDYGNHQLMLNISDQDLPTLDLQRAGGSHQIRLKMTRASKAALRLAITETEQKYGLDSSMVYQAVTLFLQCHKACQFTSQKWCVVETTPN